MNSGGDPSTASSSGGTPGSGGLLGPADHPLRARLSEEMHVRIFPAMQSPERLCQLVMLSGEAAAIEDFQHVTLLCAHFGVPPPEAGRKHFNAHLGPVRLHWERHTEFSTYTFLEEGPFSHPFAEPPLRHIPADWLAALPGTVLRATLLSILPPDAAEPGADELARLFRPDDLVSCMVQHDEARIWTDFRLHANGFGQLLVHDRGLKGGDLARLAQKLLELGNYRKMALLALPVAQELTPEVSKLESGLTAITARMAEGHEDDDRLLSELSVLAAELAEIAARTSYRISATRAYYQLAMDRILALEETRIPGFQTLSDFTERRLVPAERTCNSFARRLEDLANRAGRASDLLRTRISHALERQNAGLLASMDRRADLQLRLQETVEGLSVAAISYYLVALIGYGLKGLQAVGLIVNLALAEAVSVIPVLVLVAWLTHRIRRGIARKVNESEE